jgi:hypothetical protein
VKSLIKSNSPPASQKLGTRDSVSPKLTFVRIMDTIYALCKSNVYRLFNEHKWANDEIAGHF